MARSKAGSELLSAKEISALYGGVISERTVLRNAERLQARRLNKRVFFELVNVIRTYGEPPHGECRDDE